MKAVLGVADHGGWAVCVTVAASGGVPVVVDRRRIALIESGVPTQPYHHDTVNMPRDEAEALVVRVRESVMRTTRAQLTGLCDELQPQHSIVSMVMRVPPLTFVPVTVAEAHQSYSVMCRADSVMYHDALATAAQELGIPVELEDRDGEVARAAERFDVGVHTVERFLRDVGASLGPPWQKEHRLATAAAIRVLAGHHQIALYA